ncbi:MAG TPA: hypothetical protein VG267_19615 [Terracidiphilus sp.]|nr:hypothetical protein [Terracidiphilus sp.]
MKSTARYHILSICSLGLFCILAAGSADNDSPKGGPVTTDAPQPVATPFVDTSDERKKDAQAVSSVCGWKAFPQVAEYQIGMSLSEAQRLGGANLKCEQSSPITSGSVFDMLEDKFLAPDSDISDSDEGNSVHGFARAAAKCDTVVNGNLIHLWFFPSREGGPVLLGEAINDLNSSDIVNQKEAIAKGISEKYGVDIADGQQTCSNPSGVDADYAMDVSVTQPLCSIPSSPDLPPDAGCILMQDNALLRRGGTIIAQRDAAGVKAAEKAAADKARQAADVNRY